MSNLANSSREALIPQRRSSTFPTPRTTEIDGRSSNSNPTAQKTHDTRDLKRLWEKRGPNRVLVYRYNEADTISVPQADIDKMRASLPEWAWMVSAKIEGGGAGLGREIRLIDPDQNGTFFGQTRVLQILSVRRLPGWFSYKLWKGEVDHMWVVGH